MRAYVLLPSILAEQHRFVVWLEVDPSIADTDIRSFGSMTGCQQHPCCTKFLHPNIFELMEQVGHYPRLLTIVCTDGVEFVATVCLAACPHAPRYYSWRQGALVG